MTGRNPKFLWLEAVTRSDVRPHSAKTVATAISSKWNGDNNHPFFCVSDLMEATGLSESSVERALRTLRENGWVIQVQRGGRRGTVTWASRYRMTYPQPVNPDFPTRQFEVPNPSVLTSQPVSSDTPVDLSLDLSLRPESKDPQVPHPFSTELDADECPWCNPYGGTCRACHRTTKEVSQ